MLNLGIFPPSPRAGAGDEEGILGMRPEVRGIHRGLVSPQGRLQGRDPRDPERFPPRERPESQEFPEFRGFWGKAGSGGNSRGLGKGGEVGKIPGGKCGSLKVEKWGNFKWKTGRIPG